MDNEATKVVFSRIQALDPDNASKIMGFIFIQDPPEKEMLRLASCPETLLISLINQAKTHLGILTNASSATNNGFGPSLQVPDQLDSTSVDPIMSPSRHADSMIFPFAKTHLGISSNNLSASSPRISNNNGFRPSGFSLQVPDQFDSPSFDPIVSPNGRSDSAIFPFGKTHLGISPNTSSMSSPRVIIPANNGYHMSTPSPSSPWASGFSLQVPDQLDSPSMDPIMSPSGHSDSMVFPSNSANMHRRSFSVNDAFLGGEEGSGFGWRPCMYYARGFCKNGVNCKFLHSGGQFGDFSDSEGSAAVGSPSKLDGFDEMLRMKAIQQQQRLSQLMSGGGSFPYNKGMSFLNDSPRSAAATLMMGEEFHKFGRSQSERSDFSAIGFGATDSSARQIYLTFPADSTFKEEDVSNYFSTFGPVQDVRIPYQQKRMFGFVTFVYPETVKMILAKGNPHFVCDSRVLVKPYKEKGKIPEKRQHPFQFERGDFAGCLSPTLDSRESYDLPVGPRMLLNNQETMRRKLEHADIQQALELQGRRLMNLQLMQMKNHHHLNHHHAIQFNPHGNMISSSVQSQLQRDHNFLLQSENFDLEDSEDASNGLGVVNSLMTSADEQQDELLHKVNEVSNNGDIDVSGNKEENDHHESFEHILPDNLFSSPTKSAAENGSMFSSDLSEAETSSSVAAVPSVRPWQA